MHKFLHWFIIHNMILITVGSAILLYLAFFDGGKPLEFLNNPVQTV